MTTTPTQTHTTGATGTSTKFKVKLFDSTIKDHIYPSPETDSMVSYGVLLVMVILISVYLLKVVIETLYYLFIGRSGSHYRAEIRYAILRDISMMFVAYCIFSSLHYYHKLDFIETNIDNIMYGFVSFIALWMLSSWI